jgi:Fe-S cluster biogenesis protein NfuA
MLLLYGLHPLELETRVRQALDTVRPSLESHGGDVELLGIDEGVVRVRLQGSSSGHVCPSTTATQRQALEAAVYDAAPDVVALEIEAPAEQSSAAAGLVQLGRLKSSSEGRTA